MPPQQLNVMALKDYFFFTKEERQGVMALLIIISSIIGVRVFIAAITGQTVAANNNPVYKHYVRHQKAPVELNTADTLQLQELSGIGPGFARRIVQYRHKLGGFYAKEQLTEVYGLSQEIYNKIKADVTVDATKIKKLNVNGGNIAWLKRHPYISYYEAKAIVDYRESKASNHIDNIDELSGLKDLKENWEIIKIYISAE